MITKCINCSKDKVIGQECTCNLSKKTLLLWDKWGRKVEREKNRKNGI